MYITVNFKGAVMGAIKTSLTIPSGVVKIIEEIITHRIDNREDEDEAINRNGVAIEMMKIGAQVMKKSLKDDDDVQKAYSKEFEIVVKLLLGVDYFTRLTASNAGEIDFMQKSPELDELRSQWADFSKSLLP